MENPLISCKDAILLVGNDKCSAYQFRNETGEGTITLYEVFPGVTLSFNDFHMRCYESEFKPSEDIFCIDHCREGRLEYPAASNAFSYVEAGDLKLDRRLSHTGHFEMPLSHYHGAMVALDMKKASRFIPEEIKDFPVNVYALQEKYCKDIYPMVIHGDQSIEHIFSELYNVPSKIREWYFKVKVLELLLFLDALELPEQRQEHPYFYKSQIEKIKAIRELITSDLTKSYTIDELSRRFDISQTAMKNCFKSVYGSPIFAYLRVYRMNYAASLMKADKSLKISDIAGIVGYDNPGKFSCAFREVMGWTPLEYRKTFVQTEQKRLYGEENR